MAEPMIPPKAKLFIGILFATPDVLSGVEKILMKKFGEIDFMTKEIPFSHTKYYESMGRDQKKVLLSFARLVRREDIIWIKLFTNKLEKRFSEKGNRKVNIDPGYCTLSNVFLATCKEYFHRVYLGRGVYLENEYRYVGKQYQPWEWTYPDYRKPDYLYFFHEMRSIYYRQIQKK